MNEFLNIFINYGTLLAYIAFSTDLGMQIYKIYDRESSDDIAWKGTVARLIGCIVLIVKFVGVQDIYLIVGQTLFTFVVIAYLTAILHYRHLIKKSK